MSWTPIRPKRPVANKAKMVSELKRAMEITVADGLQFVQDYPPARGRSRRTGTLGRSWSRKVRFSTSSIEGEVGSNSGIAPYNKQVQGKQQRSLFKSIGWRNQDQLADRMEKRLRREASAAVKRAVK